MSAPSAGRVRPEPSLMKNMVFILLPVCALAYLSYIHDARSLHFTGSVDYAALEKFNRQLDDLDRTGFPPLYSPIVLVVLDGAARDFLYSEAFSPRIVGRWRKGGLRYTAARCVKPTVSAPNYFSILTGAPPFLHGVTNNERRFRDCQKIVPLFPALSEAGLTSCVIGFHWYKDMLEGHSRYVPAECCEKADSREVASALLDLIAQDRLPFFTLAHFLAPDSAAHAGGYTGGPGYSSAIGEIDVIMDEILGELQKHYPQALLILTADHGMSADGTHGGADRDSLEIPLYLFGPGMAPAVSRRRVHNIAVAPSICAVAGIPLPPFSAEGPLYELLPHQREIHYLNQSIARKERLAGELSGERSRTVVLGPDYIESLLRRDGELTDEIMDHPEHLRRKALFYQRPAVSLILLIFLLWLVYRSERGVPVLAIFSGLLVAAAGAVHRFMDSGGELKIACSIFSILVFSGTLAFHRLLADPSLLLRLREGLFTGRVLALLLWQAVLISGLFMPFWAMVPDTLVYPFRFFMLSLFSPFMIMALLSFFSSLSTRGFAVADRP